MVSHENAVTVAFVVAALSVVYAVEAVTGRFWVAFAAPVVVGVGLAPLYLRLERSHDGSA